MPTLVYEIDVPGDGREIRALMLALLDATDRSLVTAWKERDPTANPGPTETPAGRVVLRPGDFASIGWPRALRLQVLGDPRCRGRPPGEGGVGGAQQGACRRRPRAGRGAGQGAGLGVRPVPVAQRAQSCHGVPARRTRSRPQPSASGRGSPVPTVGGGGRSICSSPQTTKSPLVDAPSSRAPCRSPRISRRARLHLPHYV